jgi:hypothetical protein
MFLFVITFSRFKFFYVQVLVMGFVVGHGIELLDMTLNEAFGFILKFQFAKKKNHFLKFELKFCGRTGFRNVVTPDFEFLN